MPTAEELDRRFAGCSTTELEEIIASDDYTPEAKAVARARLERLHREPQRPPEPEPLEYVDDRPPPEPSPPQRRALRAVGVLSLGGAAFLAWQHWEWASHGTAQWTHHAVGIGFVVALAAFGLDCLERSALWAITTTIGIAASAVGLAAIGGVEGAAWIAVGVGIAAGAAALLRLMWPRSA